MATLIFPFLFISKFFIIFKNPETKYVMIFDNLEAGTLYNIYLIATDELNEKSVVMTDSEVLTYRITTKDDDSKFIIKIKFFF